MRRLTILFVALLAVSMLSAACTTAPVSRQQSQAPANTDQAAAATNLGGSNTQSTPEVSKPQESSVEVTVYYADDNLTELQPETHKITYTSDVEKYQKVIDLLGRPAQKGHEPLWSNFKYHSVSLQDGLLTLDADSKNQYNVGSTGEDFAINALKKSLFQFPEVKRIRILVDGKPTDSLMGHVDVSEPLTRE